MRWKCVVLLCVLSLVAVSCGQDVDRDRAMTRPLTPADGPAYVFYWPEAGQSGPPVSLPAPVPAFPGEPVPGCDVDTIVPDTFEATMMAGECLPQTKEVCLTGGTITRADIVFAIDRTGSMFDEIDQLKMEINNVIAQLSVVVSDPAFGVISYMDYPAEYTSCGYSSFYGSGSDLPYILNQPVDTDGTLSQNAINALTLGNGEDWPESEARVFFETYSDANLGWRAGAQRIVVNIGDAFPHDCDFGSCVGVGLGSSGWDPGRDAAVLTGDDIALLDALNGMAANGITLVRIQSEDFDLGGATLMDLWNCWTAITGGFAVRINPDGTIPGGMSLADLIESLIQDISEMCEELTLVASPGYEDWIRNLTPIAYEDLMLPATVGFTYDLCVPEGTPDGVYQFEICAVCDGGIRVCQDDVITVRNVIPVDLDMHPTSCPNPLNVKKKGVTPAAVLGTMDFDVSMIDPATVMVNGVAPIRWNYDDVAAPYEGELCGCTTEGPDGYMDLTLKFDSQALVATLVPLTGGQEVVLTLTGNLYDGTPIEGADCMIIKPQSLEEFTLGD